MRVGLELLQTIQRAEQLLQNVDPPPAQVGPVVQERRFRDAFGDTGPKLKDPATSLLHSAAFKVKFKETVQGTSYRSEHAEKTKEKFQALLPQLRASSPVGYKPTIASFKASDLQRSFIRG